MKFKDHTARLALLALFANLSLFSSQAATLRHHYTLDRDGSDSKANAALTTKGDCVVFQSTGGAAGGFVSLGGSDDYLLASLDIQSPLSILRDYQKFRPFSVAFWVRQSAAQASSSTQAVFGMTTNSKDPSTFNTGFEVVTREGSGRSALRVRVRNGGAGSNQGEIRTGFNISDGTWHHVVASFRPHSRSVYVDGVFRGENTTPVEITTHPIGHFAVGAFLRAGQILDDLNGDVDDLQIYQGALSGAEAQRLFKNPGTPLDMCPGETQTVSSAPIDPIDFVDPLIGAEGRGYCVPGPCLPHSSIYPSPDVVSVSPSGYKAGDDVVGFSQLHAQGAGPSTPSFGNFLISPQLGPGINERDHASPISQVSARPHAYRARLTRWKTDCTVVPSAHSALYQFEFSSHTDARIYFDVARKLGRSDGMTEGSVRIDPRAGSISGGGSFDGNWNPVPYKVYFYAQVSAKPKSGGTWKGDTAKDNRLTASTRTRQRLGGWLGFDTSSSPTVMLKIAVSFVSVKQARTYLEQEIPAWDIAGLEIKARKRWNDELAVLQAPGIPKDEGRKLYTALYHSLVQPRDRTGDVSGWPKNAPFWDDQYTLWDTWQTLFPLLAIVQPETVAANVNSFGERYRRNGVAETAFIQGKDFQVGQGGDSADFVIADAYAKRIRGINWKNAWSLMQFNAKRRTVDYQKLGYVASDGVRGGYDGRMRSGSSTLAFAFGDWCAAQVGFGLGHKSAARPLLKRSGNWRKVWDASAESDGFTGFVRARNRNGDFSNTDPTSGTDFYQGTCWNYSFNVPHERDAMIELMGGRDRFIERLEHALGKRDNKYIDFTNEPSFQTTWLFCRAGRPDRSSYWADQLRRKFGEYSFPGDEDSGAMSSLYFFLTAGFFPIAGQDFYYIHGPRVPRLEFKTATGKTFTVIAENAGEENIYVQSATLNGKPLTTPVFRHSDILAGSTLAFKMGTNPSKWGRGPSSNPATTAE